MELVQEVMKDLLISVLVAVPTVVSLILYFS